MKTKQYHSVQHMAAGILLGSFILLLNLAGYGQITIGQEDMPVPGDTLRKSIALNAAQYDFSLTGENFTWDMGTMLPVSQTVDTFVLVTETPVVYWPFFLLSANMASPQGSSPIEQIPLTDLYNFYNNSDSHYTDVGFAATALGIPLPFKFDQPDVLFEFPVAYGNVDSSHSGLELAIPDVAYLMIDRRRVNTADGWGILRTPYGSFEVLRIRSDVVEYDSIYIDSLGVGLPVNLEYTEYKWMAEGEKIPLLKATISLLGTVAEYRDSVRDLTVGVEENILVEGDGLTLFPNPVSKVLHLHFFNADTGVKEISVFGLDGKLYYTAKIKPARIGTQTFTLDLASHAFVHGRYLLRLRSANKVSTEVFVFTP